MARVFSREPIQQIGLFVFCLVIFTATAAPSLYTYDSAEFVIGAVTLGIVHSPGYPLYLLIAHLFTLLPIGDIPFRVNLLSSVCLALTAPILFTLIKRLLKDRWIALSGCLSVVLSFLVWSSAIRAEVYTPQLLTLAITGWALARAAQKPSTGAALIVGAAYGIALAMDPGSILFAPGILIVFLALKLTWRDRVASGLLALILFALPLLYFPIRYAANPMLNLAGQYDAAGNFQRVDLTTLQGILWVLCGQQFSSLFFTNGLLPSADQLSKFVYQFWHNFIGIGILIGFVGIVFMPRKVRWAWLIFFVPYAYFFASYGAIDNETMYSPALLLWGIAIAYGLDWLMRHVERWLYIPLALGLPLVMLAVNLPLLDVHSDNHVRERAQIIMDALPAGYVFGGWFDLVPMQYLQIIEGERPDLHLYNLFLFDDKTLAQYVSTLNSVVFVGNQIDPSMLNGGGGWTPIELALPDLEHPYQLRTELAGYWLTH